jgi:hypothetical protein
LHRALGPGETAAPVSRVAAGVGDEGSAVQAVQRDAVNGGLVDPGRVKLAAAVAAMVALDPPYSGQQRPVDVARRVGGVDQGGGLLVALQGAHRDTCAVQDHWC